MMRPFHTWRAGSWLVAIAFCARAAMGVEVELTTDHTTVSMDEEIQVQVTIKGGSTAEEPQFQNAGDFDIQAVGTTSQMQFINGVSSSSNIHNFVFTPKKAGTFRVGPVRVRVGSQTLESNVVNFTVVKSGGKGQVTERDSFYRVQGEVDNPAPYVNQQVTYTFRFLNRGRMQGAQLNWPDFNGFVKEELGKQREYEQMIDGARWGTTEMKLALFPTAPGELTIGSATLYGNALVEGRKRRGGLDDTFLDDSFFGLGMQTKRITLKTEPSVLRVQPLPSEGKPAKFSGLVGQLTVRGVCRKTPCRSATR